MRAKVIQIDRNWFKQERPPADANSAIIAKRQTKIPAKFYTVREVAERLNVSIDVIYDCTYRGWLKFQRVGRAKRISEEDLLDFLHQQNLRKI